MLCHLPAPYPDELLYSVITRHVRRSGASAIITAVADVFGRRTRLCSLDLASSLNAVSERTWLIWGMTGEDIANRLTLFPYYARYVPDARAPWCLDALRSDNGTGVHTRLGVTASRVRVPKFLRFCPTCRAHDLQLYGETYWRRTHQIAGVLVCPDHGDPLVESTARMKPTSFGAFFIDATNITADAASANMVRFGGAEAAIAFKIANRCRDMLLGPITSWPQENMPSVYRHAALERGFSQGATKLSPSKFESAFVAFYGQPLLLRLSCEVQFGKDSNWLREIFRPHSHRRVFHPLQHALVQIFLERTPVDGSRRNLFGAGPWKCPNPYATHDDAYPIKQPLKISILCSGEMVASVECGCGFRFTFIRVSDSDPNQPIIRKICGYGPTWKTEAARLREAGLSIRAIAKKMDIDCITVVRLLRKKTPNNQRQPSQLVIEGWRHEWLKLLDQIPGRRRSLTRNMNNRLYIRLWRWDRNWLFKQPQFGNFRFTQNARVDWVSRDKEWSQALRVAAQRIRDSGLPRRIVTTTIINAAGLPISTITRHARQNRLPFCQAVLKEFSETSLDDSRERRLRAAVHKVRERG